MHGRIYARLRSVRGRQDVLTLLRYTAVGMLAAAPVGIGLGVWRLLGGHPSPWLAGSLLAAGPIVGLLVGCARLRGIRGAAAAVDVHYGLKDRLATAIAFLAKGQPTALHRLQVEDAVAHLDRVKAAEVVPMRLPRMLPFAAGAFGLAIALLAWPIANRSAKALPVAAPAEVLEVANDTLDGLKDLDQIAKREKLPELERLVQQLRKKAEEIKQPGVDKREALAKLSEMQAAIMSEQAQYNTGLVDGQLKSLGEAIAPAESLEAAGQAMQNSKFEEAAKELEKLEEPQLDRKEAKAVEEKLEQVANQMGAAGLGQMSDAATQLMEGIKGGHTAKFKKGAKSLAKAARNHNRRRRINQLLAGQADGLNENKGKIGRNSLAKGKAPKSTSPSLNFGLGTAGNINGDKTSLLAKRNLQEVTGDPSDGDSEMETTHSPEGRQTAARGYKAAYQKALKQSEAVLDSEPIPLGHRQTIRRYFESIRPQNGDADEAKEGGDAPTSK